LRVVLALAPFVETCRGFGHPAALHHHLHNVTIIGHWRPQPLHGAGSTNSLQLWSAWPL
jgi:hypothetical protein